MSDRNGPTRGVVGGALLVASAAAALWFLGFGLATTTGRLVLAALFVGGLAGPQLYLAWQDVAPVATRCRAGSIAAALAVTALISPPDVAGLALWGLVLVLLAEFVCDSYLYLQSAEAAADVLDDAAAGGEAPAGGEASAGGEVATGGDVSANEQGRHLR